MFNICGLCSFFIELYITFLVNNIIVFIDIAGYSYPYLKYESIPELHSTDHSRFHNPRTYALLSQYERDKNHIDQGL